MKDKAWSSWYGVDIENRFKGEFLPFQEARRFARSLNLKSQREWGKYYKSGKKPNNIPCNPNIMYKDKGWRGMDDWLGKSKLTFLPFGEAREFIKSLGLESSTEWYEYSKSGKRLNNIPSSPSKFYKDKGWVDWGDWLGTGNVSPCNREFLPFEESRVFARSLGLRSYREWKEYSKSGKRPNNIPSDPSKTYKDKGWKGYGDWSGKERVKK